MKNVLIISCILFGALSVIVVANQWLNVSNDDKGGWCNKSAEYLAKIAVKDRIEDLESKYGSYECIVKPRENHTLVIFQPENMVFNNSYEVIKVYVKDEEIIKVETEIVTPCITTPEPPEPVEIDGIKIVEVNERGIFELALMDSEVSEIVEFLERRYGKVRPEIEHYNPYGDTSALVHFSIDIDPQKMEATKREPVSFPTDPIGFSCWVNITTGEVEEIIVDYLQDRSIDTVLRDEAARSRLETLKEEYGNVSCVYITSYGKPDMAEIRFTPEFNPHEDRTEELHGILCIVDTKAKKVVKLEEFGIPPITLPTPPRATFIPK